MSLCSPSCQFIVRKLYSFFTRCRALGQYLFVDLACGFKIFLAKAIRVPRFVYEDHSDPSSLSCKVSEKTLLPIKLGWVSSSS